MSDIIEKFLDVDTQEALEAQISAGDVTDDHIAFIDSPRKIWARGRYYNGGDTVPFANDLTGRIEATPEEFTFRPSAGDKSIRDESALIKKIKGNTIVWNQYSKPFSTDNWHIASFFSAEIVDDVLKLTLNSTSSSTEICRLTYTVNFAKHKWLAIAIVKADSKVTIRGIASKGFVANQKCMMYAFYSAIDTRDWYWGINTASGYDTPTSVEVYSYTVFDLTQMFGAGNEPTTIEEFRALFPNDYYDYNTGELLSMTSNGLFANGFNQFNGEYAEVLPNNTYYLGGTYTSIGFTKEIGGELEAITVPTDKLYTPLSRGYIYAVGTDININLSHTGVRNGEYEPYWDATKDLSIIQKYFPEGMRSAGSVYDEISFDETTQKWVAIQRVGSVDLGSLSWALTNAEKYPGLFIVNFAKKRKGLNGCSTLNLGGTSFGFADYANYADNTLYQNSSNTYLYAKYTQYTDTATFKSAMSGVMLYYELAEPIITTIEEPVDLSYKVGDFGIEKMLSDSFSAPFKADIIYQFNATDRVRENSMNISKLSKKHALLENEVDTLESKVDTEIESINTELDTIKGKVLTTDAQTLTEEQQLQVAQNISTDDVPSSIVRRRGDGSITASIIHDGTYNYAMPLSSEDIKNDADYTLLITETSPTPDDIMSWDKTGVLKSSGVHIASSVAEVQEASPDALPTSEQMMSVISDAIPTQIAEVMEVVPTSDVTIVMYPNRLYEASYASTITALRLVLDTTGANMSGDNIWKVRFTAGGTNMLFTILDNATSSEANIYWLNGTPPTFDEWGFHEITFKRAGQQVWLGEWKCFQLA